jgi:hypothetical protein
MKTDLGGLAGKQEPAGKQDRLISCLQMDCVGKRARKTRVAGS